MNLSNAMCVEKSASMWKSANKKINKYNFARQHQDIDILINKNRDFVEEQKLNKKKMVR